MPIKSYSGLWILIQTVFVAIFIIQSTILLLADNLSKGAFLSLFNSSGPSSVMSSNIYLVATIITVVFGIILFVSKSKPILISAYVTYSIGIIFTILVSSYSDQLLDTKLLAIGTSLPNFIIYASFMIAAILVAYKVSLFKKKHNTSVTSSPEKLSTKDKIKNIMVFVLFACMILFIIGIVLFAFNLNAHFDKTTLYPR